MLTEEEKIKLREEEIYREQVRKSLELPKTKGQKILGFFNSSLGGWILTYVLVGLGTFSYNYFHDYLERERDKERKITKLIPKYNHACINTNHYWIISKK